MRENWCKGLPSQIAFKCFSNVFHKTNITYIRSFHVKQGRKPYNNCTLILPLRSPKYSHLCVWSLFFQSLWSLIQRLFTYPYGNRCKISVNPVFNELILCEGGIFESASFVPNGTSYRNQLKRSRTVVTNMGSNTVMKSYHRKLAKINVWAFFSFATQFFESNLFSIKKKLICTIILDELFQQETL